MSGELTINSLADYNGEMVQIRDIGVKNAGVLCLESNVEKIVSLEDLQPLAVAPEIGVAMTNLIRSISMHTVEKIDKVGHRNSDGDIVISREQLNGLAMGNIFMGTKPFLVQPKEH